MKNIEIRTELSKRRIRYYELARALGVSACTLSHWLGLELPEEKKQEILQVIRTMEI